MWLGLALSCVWFLSELGCNENADSNSCEAAMFRGRIGFILVRPPHADQDYGSCRIRDS